jgi:hypothetical protein
MSCGSSECGFTELPVFWSKGREVVQDAFAGEPFLQTRSQHAL